MIQQYLNTDTTSKLIKRLVSFENDLNELFDKHSLSLRENLGRRNMLMSQAQEKFLASALTEAGIECIHNGKPGEADIVLLKSGNEIEVKLTSGSGGSWSLQCDYETLVKKKELDFIYMLCDSDFKKFAILHFEKLTPEDFFNPSSGSRSKARMNKSNAMKKCTPVFGSVRNKNLRMIDTYSRDLKVHEECSSLKLDELYKRLQMCRTDKQIKKVETIIKNTKSRFNNKSKKIIGKIDYWKNASGTYEISLSEI